MQVSHAGWGISLDQVAKTCGFSWSDEVRDMETIHDLRERFATHDGVKKDQIRKPAAGAAWTTLRAMSGDIQPRAPSRTPPNSIRDWKKACASKGSEACVSRCAHKFQTQKKPLIECNADLSV